MRRKEPKHYYASVHEYFPVFKWQKCRCCGEEVKLERMYRVTFYNDVYLNHQEPFFICKKCALKKINPTFILNRAIPKYLAEYYEGTEEFERFKEISNRIIF